jgi:ERCC4-type nuclease
MKIIIDTREQTPWQFPSDVQVERGTLATGDYSLAELESLVAIERKSLSDFIGCCSGDNRQRFKRELQRLKAYRCRAVVIEANMGQMMSGQYRSSIHPHSVVGTLFSWQTRYNIPFVLAGDAMGGTAVCMAIFRTFLKQLNEITQAVQAQTGTGQAEPGRIRARKSRAIPTQGSEAKTPPAA